MSNLVLIEINPVSKPRQTRADKWKQRPCVMRYRAYADELGALWRKGQVGVLPEAYHLIILVPMPKSWSQKKKTEYLWQPCQSKPDKDNLEKAFLDALYSHVFPDRNDCEVWDSRVTKLWGERGALLLRPIAPFKMSELIQLEPDLKQLM